MRIYLIGFMGSGKSTLGKELASRLGCSFLDLDQFIELSCRKSVPEIFRDEGELSFREKERACLGQIAEKDHVVVATGGGAPCFFDNMEFMNRTGCCVFLDVQTGELARRLTNEKADRPLIRGKGPDELVRFIGAMMAERRPYYEKARCVVKGDSISVEDVIKKMEEDCE